MPHKMTRSSQQSKRAISSQKSKDIVSLDTVRHVAKLAHIRLSDAEVKSMQKELNDILTAFKALDKVNTKGVQPAFHPQPVQDILREDKLEPTLGQEKALANTKHKQEGYFKGPKVV